VVSQRLDGTEPADLPRTIWYMGAKARVIPRFLERVVAESLDPGQSVLDLFSGSGIVSAWCAGRFRVVANDVQRYAHVIARSLIERPPGRTEDFIRSLDIERDLLPAMEKNRRTLGKRFAAALALEDRLLEEHAASTGRRSAADFAARYRAFLLAPGGLYGGPGRGPAGAGGKARAGGPADRRPVSPLYRRAVRLLAEESIGRYRKDPSRRPACLITSYYANVYYGLRQAIDIDSLRAAIEELGQEDPCEARKRIHYLSALLHAASITTSGTSHFAQPRQLRKDSEVLAMARRRRTSVLSTFRAFSGEIAARLAAVDLHRENRSLCGDYRSLLLEDGGQPRWAPAARADLVYVDPPYTADNYSRFYHVLETLVGYDYPPLERDGRGEVTAGRYPEIARRFQSAFCRSTEVEAEFERVIGASANSGSRLVISYGSPNGLLLKVYRRRRKDRDPVLLLAGLCRRRYRDVEVRRRSLLHSGQGDSNIPTDELLVVCRDPR
jgi:adenine-specific DNA methylase